METDYQKKNLIFNIFVAFIYETEFGYENESKDTYPED